MKPFKEFVSELLESEAPTNTTAGVDNKDSKPLFTKSKVAGCDCIDVDDEAYHKFAFGKRPFARWTGYIEDPDLREFVQKNYSSSSKLMVRNSKTGTMTFLKRGS